MIGIKLSISSTLLEDLDLLDKAVDAALERGINRTVKSAYQSMIKQTQVYGWYPPNTSGNLRDSIGYVTSTDKLINSAYSEYSATVGKYMASIFALADYAWYLEFGTTHAAPYPFFTKAVWDSWGNIENVIRSELMLTTLIKRRK